VSHAQEVLYSKERNEICNTFQQWIAQARTIVPWLMHIEEDCKPFKHKCKVLLLGTPFSTSPTMFIINWVTKVWANQGRVPL